MVDVGEGWFRLVKVGHVTQGVQGRFRALAAAELEKTMPESWEDGGRPRARGT